jgi:predicted methyltransferase
MTMRLHVLFAGAALAMAACATEARSPSVNYAAVLADPIRPDADRARDADRKPAELVAFAVCGAATRSPSSRPAAAISPGS